MYVHFYSFLHSLKNYDLLYYTLAYIGVISFLIANYSKKLAFILQYVYSITLVGFFFSIFNYQLIKFGTINLNQVPTSLKLFLILLFVMLISLMFFEREKNKLSQQYVYAVNTNENVCAVNQKENVCVVEPSPSKMNNYVYNYNNDDIYSEPNTTNIKVQMTNPIQHKLQNNEPNKKLIEKIDTNTQNIKKIEKDIVEIQNDITELKQDEFDVIDENYPEELKNLKQSLYKYDIKSQMQNNNNIILNNSILDASNKELDDLIKNTKKKFDDKNVFPNEFGKKISNQIETLSENIAKQKKIEEEKIKAEIYKQQNEMKEKYRKQLEDFEKQFDIIESINNNNKLDDNKQDHNDLHNEIIPLNNNGIDVSNDITNSQSLHRDDKLQIVPNDIEQENISETQNIVVNQSMEDLETKITEKVLNKTKEMIETSTVPMKEKINKLDTNIIELANSTQGIVDRMAKILEFMAISVEKKQ